MTIGQLISFEAMNSQIEVPCSITPGPSMPVHMTNKYMFVRLLPESRVENPNAAGVGYGENTERSVAEVKICPECFGQWLYKMTQAAKEAQFVK